MHNTMASTHQPLLNPTHTKPPYSKLLIFFTMSISALCLLLLLPNSLSTPAHLCRRALNPQTCQQFASEQLLNGAASTPTHLLQASLIKQSHLINRAFLHARKLRDETNGQGPLSDCLELLDQSNELVLDSIKALRRQTASSHADARAWLSGVVTNHVTCSDGLKLNSSAMGPILEELISRGSASLAMLAAVSEPHGYEEVIENLRGSLPWWITAADRKLLQSSVGEVVNADVTVAADGSGDFEKVNDAIAAAPDKSSTRYVIYVKSGTYRENVIVGKNKKNLMIVGDGMTSTIITASLNVVDGSTTFNSATLAAVGEGFILQDICIQNKAGPEKHQAVALRVGADKSVIHRCRIEAYQDTLYTHSLRQFYRNTYVRGTVDFVFGNAAVVFQKCTLEARKPMQGQKNMITAQGRTDPNQNTGTSIQDSEIRASSDLEPVKGSFRTYLGRPWKEYSRTVVMQSDVSDVIDPAGWAEWSGDFALATLYYGEYLNRGPGAGTSGRVKWEGYHANMSYAEAMAFTVKEMIQGGEWIGSSGVTFIEGL